MFEEEEEVEVEERKEEGTSLQAWKARLEANLAKPKPGKKPKPSKKPKPGKKPRLKPDKGLTGLPLPVSEPVPLPDDPVLRVQEIKGRLNKIDALNTGKIAIMSTIGVGGMTDSELMATEGELRTELARLEAEGLPAQAEVTTYDVAGPEEAETTVTDDQDIDRIQRQLQTIEDGIAASGSDRQRRTFKAQRYKLKMLLFKLSSERLVEAEEEVGKAASGVQTAQKELDRLIMVRDQPLSGVSGHESRQNIQNAEDAESRLRLAKADLTTKNDAANHWRMMATGVDAPPPGAGVVARPGAGPMFPERYGGPMMPKTRAIEKIIEAETGIKTLPFGMMQERGAPGDVAAGEPAWISPEDRYIESASGGVYGRGHPSTSYTRMIDWLTPFAQVPVLRRLSRDVRNPFAMVPVAGTTLEGEIERYSEPYSGKTELMGGHYGGGEGFAGYAPPDFPMRRGAGGELLSPENREREIQLAKSSVRERLVNRLGQLDGLNRRVIEEKSAWDALQDKRHNYEDVDQEQIDRQTTKLADLMEAQEVVAAEVNQLKNITNITLGPKTRQVEEGQLVRGPRGKWLMKPSEAAKAEEEFEQEQLEQMRALGMIE